MSGEMRNEALEFARANPLVHVGTVDGDTPHVRVMTTAKIEDDFTLWFATHKSSAKVKQLTDNPKICVAYLLEQQDLRVYGNVEQIDTKEAKEDIWIDAFTFAFPGGVDDPQLMVLKVDPTSVLYRNIPKYGMEPKDLWSKPF